MLIGITALGTDSIFAKGSNRTGLAFAFWAKKAGHNVKILSPTITTSTFIDSISLLKKHDLQVESFDLLQEQAIVFDLIVEISWFLPPEVRSRVAKKSVMWFHVPPLFNDMESSIYMVNQLVRRYKNLHEVWIPSVFSDDDKIYIERVHGIPCRKVPWIWECETLEDYSSRQGLNKWNKAERNEINLAVLENNASNMSSCTIPLCIIAEIKRQGDEKSTDWVVANGESLKKNAYFISNVIQNLFPTEDVSGAFMGRIPIPELRKYRTILISHQRWFPIKHTLLDALWLDLPQIHNNEILEADIGSAAGYYYPLNEIDTGVSSYTRLKTDMKNGNGFFSAEAEAIRKMYLFKEYSWESEKHNTAFTLAVNEVTFSPTLTETKEGDKQKEKEKGRDKGKDRDREMRLGFADMWVDFNPDYNFFTNLLQETIKNSGMDVKVIVDQLSPDLLVYGPFGDNHTRYKNVPKIFFSGENSPHSKEQDVLLSVSHALEEGPKTLRLPLWVVEVNWFGADINKIGNPKPISYEQCVKPQLGFLGKKQKFCSFVVSNPRNQHRNEALIEISKYKKVDSAGGYMNNVGYKLKGGMGGGGGELVKDEFLQEYKFNICFENESKKGYITEKYFHAKAAGCIPVYWGDPEGIERDFDPAGGINVFGKSWEEVRAEIRRIDEDSTAYLQMYSVPAIPLKTEEWARSQMKRLAEIMLTVAHVPLSVPLSVSLSVPLSSQPNFYTAANNQYFTNIFLWLEGLTSNGISAEKATVYYWKDVLPAILSAVKQKYPTITLLPFPVDDSSLLSFSDFWSPQHYGWKLWLIKEQMKKGGTGIYMDAGVLLTRPIPDIYEIIDKDGIFLLEDEQNINRNWCHEKFVKMMACKEDELNSKQLQAGVLGWSAEHQKAKSMFEQAYYYSRTRDILVGEKWNSIPINGVHGHRHDQSILSILSYRAGLARNPLSKFVTGTDYTTAVSNKYAFYHHRGNVRLGEVTKPTILPCIHEAYVINLDRREDRMKSFVEFHPYMAEKIKRHSATDGLNIQLTEPLRHLFRNNDFQWKKSVLGCAVSHNELWQQTADKKEDNHAVLILEDDVRFNKKWLDLWEKASKHIPVDADIVYLGGILPPNKAHFGQAMTKVNEYFVTTKLNDVFSPGSLRKYFHCCNYSYILFARGARKLRKIIEEKGIFTSGDHMIVNHMEALNIHFLQPIVAGCFQDLDESYQKSMFNDFGRVDKFDSDLWNNTECFTIDEISGRTTNTTNELKNTNNNDIMIEDVNLEGNEILMLLAKGKTDEVVERSINFLREKFDDDSTGEKHYNWIRVIQQILMNQEVKIVGTTRTRLRQALNDMKIKPMNPIYHSILREILDKFDTKINEHSNGVMLYPNPASTNTYPVWYFTPDQQNNFLEREWLDEMIGKQLEYVAYGKDNINSNIHFLLIQKNSGQVQEMIIDKLNDIYKNKHHAILVHLSDEKINDDLQLYGHPAVHLVLRNYIRSNIPAQYCDKVMTLPLGYVNGRSMKGKYKKSGDRKYAWSFIGSVDKEGRLDMVQQLAPFEPNHMKLLSSWIHPTSDTAKEFIDILEDSKFIPCPKGVNFETFRLYEALEAGCIPICISSPDGEHKCYDELVGHSAILNVESWQAARSLMEKVYNNNDIMNQIQENLTKFWCQHKMKLTASILEKMNAMHYPVPEIQEEPLIVHL